MKIQNKDLIFIHKFIWSYIYKEVEVYKDRNIINLPRDFNLIAMKNKAVSLLLDDEIITNNLFDYLTKHNFCVLCFLSVVSENGCNDCPLKDCNSPYSLYQEARKGSLPAIRDIYYSIDKALIPHIIEIPEE